MKPIASLLALAAGGGRRATADIRFRWWQRFGSRRVEAPLRQLFAANPPSLHERAGDLRAPHLPSLNRPVSPTGGISNTAAEDWRARRDSNPRPPDSKSGALSS